MKRFTQLFGVMLAALFSFSMAYAENGTETEPSSIPGKNTDIVGKCYTIPGTYNAGGGSTQAGSMTSKGFKMRTNQDGERCVFKVNTNYTITKFVGEGISNYAQKADAEGDWNVMVTKVEVDGVEVAFTGGAFPAKGSGNTSILTIENIEAKESIALYFDSSNSEGNQVNFCYALDWERPEATQPTISVTPTEVALVPGATYQLKAIVDPSSFATQWVSSDEAVATVAEDGTVTAVAAGIATISKQWTDDASVAAGAVVTVADFDPSAYKVTTYDFTAMGDIIPTKGESAGFVWNEANKKDNEVFWCTNEGLEMLAIQQYYEEAKSKTGWKVVDGEGLLLGSGAGRCAAIGGIKKRQIVEFIYTGSHFYTTSTGDGIEKTAISEGVGRAIFVAKESGMIGFELDKGNYIRQINVYTADITYTVAGGPAGVEGGQDVPLFETSWDPTLEKNDMVEGEDGIFRLEKKGFLLDAGDYEYKIVTNHSWENESYPAQNAQFSVAETGSYNVTFTFDPDTKEVNVSVLKPFSILFQTNAGWEDVYAYVWSGDGENEVLGKWPGTKMYYSQRYWWFELSFDAAVAPEKIIFNNGITEGEGKAQTDDLVFENQKTYQYFIDNPDIEASYTVAGSFNGSDGDDPIFGKSWNVYLDDNNMVKGEDGIYTLTLSDVWLTESGSILYKVAKNHSWDQSWGFPDKENGNADYYVALPEGLEKAAYDITFKFNPAGNFENGYQVDCEVVYDEVATGITVISQDTNASAPNIYSLQGVRMNKLQKGLNIVNGKKMMVK